MFLKVLKCKINHYFFSFQKHGIPKLGGGGLVGYGKILTFSHFFSLETSLIEEIHGGTSSSKYES